MNKKPLFVFMDESGRKESDPFFVCGFLEIEDPQVFGAALQRVYDQIKNLSIRNRIARVDLLNKEGNLEELYNLARTYNEFELKHYRISIENHILYGDLIKVLFRKTKFRYISIVADRSDKLYEKDSSGQFPLYLKAFKLYATYCVKTPEYIFVPDSFDPSFNWNVKNGKLPMSILPLDSKACIQLQAVDILSGLVAQSLKLNKGIEPNNKEKARQPVLDILEKEIGRKISGNLTVNKPNYFSVWKIDWSKTKRSGHGQETQPRP